jgi:inositol-phosphate phosphatase/L-galactose 1-phosphate phosphatase/histidinol-phosphatase
MTESCPREFVALGRRLADIAGAVLLQYFRKPLGIADKPDESPVTQADREAESRMREAIAGAVPDHGVIGEEHGRERADAEFVWVLDPIDGTKAFISGIPVFGTLIALLRNGRPILGVVDQPVSRERWVGAAGHGATLNGEPVRVAPRGGLADAVLWSTSPHMFDGDAHEAAAYARLRESVKFVHYGGECYQYAMLASGFIDIVVEDDMAIYDYCALVPVVEGAGGVITDWQGAALGLESGGQVVAAASAGLHDAARRILENR